MIAPERDVERLRPVGELGEDLEPADDDLDRVQDGQRQRQAHDRAGGRAGSATRRTPSPTRGQQHDARHVAVERRAPRTAAGRAGPWRPLIGRSTPFISGQSGNTSPASCAVTCDPNSSSANVDDRREDREQREPLRGAAGREPRRVERADGDEHEQPEQRHRRREVGRHRLAGVVEPDGLAARATPGTRRAATAAMLGHRIERRSRWSFQARNATPRIRKPMTAATVAVDPLDPRLRVVERRDQLAVAQRPVGAAHPGVGRPHDHARSSRAGSSRRPWRAAVFWKRVTGGGSSSGTSGTGGVAGAGDAAPILRARLARRAGPSMPRRRRLPLRSRPCSARPSSRRVLAAASALAVALLAAACSPAADARLAVGRRPDRSSRSSSATQVTGPNRFVFSFLDPKTNLPAAIARPDGLGGVHRARRDRSGTRRRTRPSSCGRSRASVGEYVAQHRVPAGRRLEGRVRHRRRPTRPRRRSASTFEVHDDLPHGRRRRAGPGVATRPTAADVGGDLSRLSTDTEPGPDVLRADRSRTRWPRHAVRARVRDAGVLPERAVRPDARPGQGARPRPRPTTSRSSTSSRTSSRTPRAGSSPSLDANGQLQPVTSVDEWGS